MTNKIVSQQEKYRLYLWKPTKELQIMNTSNSQYLLKLWRLALEEIIHSSFMKPILHWFQSQLRY